ncbi:TetR/AcrR family transcriptional regulator, partial [Streptomyces sp. NPDC059215]|uniref:TetR/AcrR family transcriptional regulator n=1 Tax=Streptomyces sp. NPDC059215 TaxID=3346772 RepID=UPI0036AA252A
MLHGAHGSELNRSFAGRADMSRAPRWLAFGAATWFGPPVRSSGVVEKVLDYLVRNGYRVCMARPTSYDREAVMAAVERQFRSGGYAGTSVDDIGRAAGLGRGSLYAAFGDKHQLF